MATLIDTMGDVALMVDAAGKIVELSVGSDELREALGERWRGRAWIDTVTNASRAKVEETLQLSGAPQGTGAYLDIEHRLEDGSGLPMRYGAVSLGESGRVLAVGRDQRAVAALQQQLLNAQVALEQDYWRLRQIETRYRLLFRMASDAVLVVDEASERVIEANPAASRLLAETGKSVVGKPFPMGFDAEGSEAVRALLLETRAVGSGSVSRVSSGAGDRQFVVTANRLQQENETRFLIRLSLLNPSDGTDIAEVEPELGEVLREAPDAVVLTDGEGRIEAANRTFLDLAQLVSEEQALGQSLDRWLGRTGVDLNVLVNNLRQRNVVKLFATALRGEHGATAEVEISASVYTDKDQPTLAFFIRDIGRRLSSDKPLSGQLPKSVEQLTQQVGRVTLKELVRQSTDLIESLCIEKALELTGDNRASAAELLGLSRQSLYAKLHRYKLGDVGTDEEA
ncbi:MAG: transcriptional regulator PpsR [Chromatiales bacterium]